MTTIRAIVNAAKDASYRELGFTRSALMQESLSYLRDRLRQWKADLKEEEKEPFDDPDTARSKSELRKDIRMLESVIKAKGG